MHKNGRSRFTVGRAALLGGALALSGCVAQYQNHGYVPSEEELSEIVVGSDNRESVAQKVGVPSSAGIVPNSGIVWPSR